MPMSPYELGWDDFARGEQRPPDGDGAWGERVLGWNDAQRESQGLGPTRLYLILLTRTTGEVERIGPTPAGGGMKVFTARQDPEMLSVQVLCKYRDNPWRLDAVFTEALSWQAGIDIRQKHEDLARRYPNILRDLARGPQ